MTKWYQISALLIVVISLAFPSTYVNANEDKEREYTDQIPMPISPRERYELRENKFIKSRLSVDSIEKEENKITLKGTLERGIAAFNTIGVSEERTELYLKLSARESLPKELTEGVEYSSCILKGHIIGSPLGEVIIRGNSLQCAGKAIKTEALWWGEDGLNGVKGMTIKAGEKQQLSKEDEDMKKILLNSEGTDKSRKKFLEDMHDESLKAIPATFVPRQTKVTIIFYPNGIKKGLAK